MGDSDLTYGSSLNVDSIKVISESVGIASLGDDAAKELADDVSFRLKVIVQDAMKFMHHSKRQKLSITDIDNALKIKNTEVCITLVWEMYFKSILYIFVFLNDFNNFRPSMVLCSLTHCHSGLHLAVVESYIL